MIIAQRPNRKFGLRVVDIYFPDEIDHVSFSGDIGMILQATAPRDGASPFYTLKIDLSRDVDQLLADMSKTTRYEIRRAEKRDSLQIDITLDPTCDDLKNYADFFDGYFSLHKGLQLCNRNRLQALWPNGGLALSQVKDENGDVLAAHANVVDYEGGRTRLLYAVSFYREMKGNNFRPLISRANRLMHWSEILHFREIGFDYYDFGGIGGPSAGEKQRKIGEFKLGFGGQKCTEYNALISGTVLGRTVLAARKLLKPGRMSGVKSG